MTQKTRDGEYIAGPAAAAAVVNSNNVNSSGGYNAASSLPGDYAKKSEELLNYVALLEATVEGFREAAAAEKVRGEVEREGVRQQIEVALSKVAEAQRQVRSHIATRDDAQRSARLLQQQLLLSQSLLHEERTKGKELEARVLELELEVQRKDALMLEARTGDSLLSKISADLRNDSLKKKAALAAILSRLADAYISDEKASAILASIRKLQRELEQEAALSDSHGLAAASSAQDDYHRIEDESLRLLEPLKLPSTSPDSPTSFSPETTMQDRSFGRSHEDEYLAQIGKDRRNKRKDQISKGFRLRK